MRNLIKGTLLGGLLITGLVGALLAQTTKVSPVTTITCSGGDFVSALAATGIFTCSTPASGSSGINQLTGDGTAGPGTGSQAFTLSTSGVAAAAYTNLKATFDAKGRATVATSGTGGEINSGLFAQVRSATTTASGTGLTTDLNIGTATKTDGLTGFTICGATNANQLEGVTKTAPSAPYNIDVLLVPQPLGGNAGFGPLFGWTDGTKYQVFMLGAGTGIAQLLVLDYATSGSGNAAATVRAQVYESPYSPAPLRLKRDGSNNISFQVSPAGDYSNAQTLYTVTTGSGYLANYNTLFFGINANNGGQCGTLVSYTER